jgi:hypothetical protein
MTLCPTVRANADCFTSHTLPQTLVGTSQNGVNLSLKVSGERSKSERCLEIKLLRKKTPEPALPSNKEPSQGSHASVSDSHISLEGYSTSHFRSNTFRGSILSEGASKTGKSSVAILKIAEFKISLFVSIACSIGPFFRNRDSDTGFYRSGDPGAGTGTERH